MSNKIKCNDILTDKIIKYPFLKVKKKKCMAFVLLCMCCCLVWCRYFQYLDYFQDEGWHMANRESIKKNSGGIWCDKCKMKKYFFSYVWSKEGRSGSIPLLLFFLIPPLHPQTETSNPHWLGKSLDLSLSPFSPSVWWRACVASSSPFKNKHHSFVCFSCTIIEPHLTGFMSYRDWSGC